MKTSRRAFLAATGAVAAGALLPGDAGAGKISYDPTYPVVAYPDARIEVLDPAFARYRLFSAAIERLATGFLWAEGPVWFGDGRYLLFSDIPNNRIMKWEEETGRVSVYRKPSNYANGNTRDRQGRLITCEHDSRRVTRTEYDGSITVLADAYQGKRFNSPNDVVVKSDDSIWFTDPPYGILGHYEGTKSKPDMDHSIYRLDPKTKELTRVVDEITGPNGLAFSPDESRMYVVARPKMASRVVYVYDVSKDGKKLTNRQLFMDCGDGNADGFRVDVDGNLWMGWGSKPEQNGVIIMSPQGKQIGHIHTPERIANLTFGGAKRTRLLMTGCQSLYSLVVDVQGATVS